MVIDDNWSYQYVPWRGISASTFERYGVKTKVQADGTPTEVVFAYPNGRSKLRSCQGKLFQTVGTLNTPDSGFIFGRDIFGQGSAEAITITEGELDALSVFQMMGSKYPSVSVGNAATARNDCSKDFDYLNSFSKIYLCFDNDEPGRKAKQAVASLFDFNKIYDVSLELKDANEYLQKGMVREFSKLWWNSKRFLPEGVISAYSEFDEIIDNDTKKESVAYPFATLQDMTYGIRTGEVVLVKAPEKIGKTEFLRAIEYHLLKTTDANIGVIHLEEGKGRLLKGLAGLELGVAAHLPDSPASKEDIKNALRTVTKRDDRLHVYTHFDTDDPDVIINTIRFMAGPCGCRYIFFDHLSQVVSGVADVDERRELDYISTRLCNMVEDQDFCLFVISHVNDDGKTRGSRYIAKVADLIISLRRDPLAEDIDTRNTTYVTIEGNRFASQTGPAGRLKFDLETFRLSEELNLTPF